MLGKICGLINIWQLIQEIKEAATLGLQGAATSAQGYGSTLQISDPNLFWYPINVEDP